MFAENVISLRRISSVRTPLLHRTAGYLADGYGRLTRVMRIVASRRHLAEMDDRMLADLGISRAQASFEASRRPWDLGIGGR